MAIALGFFTLCVQRRAQLQDFISIRHRRGCNHIGNRFKLLAHQAAVSYPQCVGLDLAPKHAKVIDRQFAATMVLVEQRKYFPGRIQRRSAERGQRTQAYLWRAIAIQKGI